MPRKPTKPTTTRAALYGRVSTTEQLNGYSIGEQVRECREYAERVLQTPIGDDDIYLDEGLSGTPRSIAERPALAQLNANILAGKYTHLLVHKVDRLGRNIEVIQKILNDCVDRGIIVVFVQQHLSTESGRFFIDMFSAMAQFYSANLAEEVCKGMQGRLRSGLYVGAPPTGYKPDPDTGLIPDPQTVPLVRRMFEVYGENHSYQEVADILNHEGYRFNGDLIKRALIPCVVFNRVYLGEIYYNGEWKPGKHQPIIDQVLFQKAERVRQDRNLHRRSIPHGSRPHVFGGGIMRCVPCYARGHRAALHIRDTTHGHTYYRCYRATVHLGCQTRQVTEETLAGQMGQVLTGFVLPVDDQQRLLDLYQQQEDNTSLENVEQEIARLKAIAGRQQKLYELGDWSFEKYLSERGVLMAQIQGLELQLSPPGVQQIADIQAYIANMPALWEEADIEERSDLMQLLFSSIWVEEDHIVAVEPTMAFRSYFSLAGDMWTKEEDRRQVPCADILPAGLIYPYISLPPKLPPFHDRCMTAVALRGNGHTYKQIQQEAHLSMRTLTKLFRQEGI